MEAGHFRGDNRIKRESKRGEEKERKRKYLLKDLCEALHVNNGRRYLPKENVIMEKKREKHVYESEADEEKKKLINQASIAVLNTYLHIDE